MALSRMLSRSGYDVTVWSALPEEVETFARERRHKNLPGMVIPDEIVFTGDVAAVCEKKDLLLFAVPSIYVRSTVRSAAPYVPEGQLIVDVAKGIEDGTLMTMSAVIRDELAKIGRRARIVALSGPTHAEEVARDMPTTIVSACEDLAAAEEVQDIFMNTCMRVYTNDDTLGVELCGALKNIIALAAGISAGLGYGDNARAGLITRGLAEMTRLGLKMGCREQTFSGLAGVGDLIVTATSTHSRNNKAGFLIGQGVPPAEAVKRVGMVVEGVNALPAAIKLRDRYEVEMPIISGVDDLIAGRTTPAEVVARLMGRGKTTEMLGTARQESVTRSLPERMAEAVADI